MISLASNALVTLEEVRVGLGIPYPMEAEQNDSYTLLDNIASGHVEEYTNRTFLSGSMAQEVFDGDGANCLYDLQHTEYVTQQAPITSSPLLEWWNGSAWEAVDTDTYSYDGTEGVVYFHNDSFFIKGTKNYRVTYEYGYDGVDDVPQELKGAVIIIVSLYNRSMQYAGLSSTTDDNGRGFKFTMPMVVQIILDKYKR